MTDEMPTEPVDEEPPAKSRRVEVIDVKGLNGTKGAIARPFEKDIAAWLGKGWQRKSAGNAD